MAKHLDKFTNAFRQSRIPFLLSDVMTDGSGTMVDLTCRFLNPSAAALLGTTVEELKNKRFSRVLPGRFLSAFAPLQSIAFTGGAVSFSCNGADGSKISVTAYQAMYGTVACILDTQSDARPDTTASGLPVAMAVLELGRGSLRCLSFNQRLCVITGWSRRELLDRFSGDISALVHKADWSGLLQIMMDAVREERAFEHEFRLLRQDGTFLWVRMRAEQLSASRGVTVLQTTLLDVDALHQTRTRLQEAQSQLESSSGQLSALFDTLPCGCAVLRQPAEGSPEVLLTSRRLANMLGYSPSEFLRRLKGDPISRIHPEDRDALSAAALSARVNRRPLRHTCRIRAKGGRILWAMLEAVWQPQKDGSSLLFAVCADVTAEKETEDALRLQKELCDLLLNRSHIINFDYDPATGMARLETYDRSGHRSTRQAESYLNELESSSNIHPDDRSRVATALRRASSRPGTGTLEYRADYNGLGWRWYRMSLVNLFDLQGNVYSLLGKAEDITDRRAAAAHFKTLAQQHKKNSKSALVSARLDLSENRILDTRGSGRHLMQVLLSNSAEACLRHIRDNIPDPKQQRTFAHQFSHAALLDAFHKGHTHHELEHLFRLEEGAIWVQSTAQVAEDPDTRRIEVFFRAADVDARHHQDAVLEALAQRDYAAVLSVDADSGLCRLYGSAPLPAGTTYRALTARYVRRWAAGPRRTLLRRALRLETILAALEHQGSYETDLSDAGDNSARLCCSWLDKGSRILLVTLSKKQKP